MDCLQCISRATMVEGGCQCIEGLSGPGCTYAYDMYSPSDQGSGYGGSGYGYGYDHNHGTSSQYGSDMSYDANGDGTPDWQQGYDLNGDGHADVHPDYAGAGHDMYYGQHNAYTEGYHMDGYADVHPDHANAGHDMYYGQQDAYTEGYPMGNTGYYDSESNPSGYYPNMGTSGYYSNDATGDAWKAYD
jgi:hypothetical protein